MKKLLAFIAAATALVSCSKTKELQQKVDQLTSKFDFSLEINEGPYYAATDLELSYKHEYTIPFKVNGNVEGLKLITDMKSDADQREPFYSIEMVSENEGILHFTQLYEYEIDGGELDLYFPYAEFSILAFNADGISSCKTLKFLEEAFYFADENYNIQRTDTKNVGQIDLPKEAGSYDLSVTHIATLPETETADVVDYGALFSWSGMKNGLTSSKFTLDPSKCKERMEDGYRIVEKHYDAIISYTANTTGAKKETQVALMQKTSESGSSSWFYIKFVQEF